ncbi:MAG TPA: cysteine--tRNA ligase [Acidimicrobiales bacterium]
MTATLPPRSPFRVRVYDTPSRSVRDVEPLVPGQVRMYTCGPTVYAPQHIGNMRSQLFADLLRRVIAASGLEVVHVVNITDVGHLTDDADAGEDKLELAAARAGGKAEDIAVKYTEQWRTDRARLGCLEPNVLCKATDHIAQQIAMVEAIEAKGLTYTTDDGVYFDTAAWPRYADFAHLQLDEQDTSGRVANVDQKRNPADFALWKFSPADVRRQQEWESPWGTGFPGWHIECSAMATEYLGRQFDLHTGGVDHVSVHHTNEVAQSEAALDVHPWVSIWVHHEFLQMGAGDDGRDAAKMSKSAGTTVLLDDLVAAGFDPLAFRWFFLQAHYRSQQDFNTSLLESAATGLARLQQRAVAARREAAGDGAASAPDAARCEPWRERFWSALADDVNAPRAVAVVAEVMRAPELTGADRWALLLDFDDALGLGFESLADDAGAPEEVTADDAETAGLLRQRDDARKARDFATADRIRDELAARGLRIVDTPEGSRLQRI